VDSLFRMDLGPAGGDGTNISSQRRIRRREWLTQQ